MPGPLPIQVTRNSYVAGMQRLAVGAAPVGLTIPGASGKVFAAFMRNAGGPIFYTVDGTVPSTTNGIELVDGEQTVLSLQEAVNFQAIQGASAGTLTISYYATA